MPQAHGTPLSLSAVLGGEDRRDTGARQRRGLFDGDDFRMGMGRAQEHGAKLLRSHDIMDIETATGEEAPIFPAAKRYPDPILGHCDLSSALLHHYSAVRGKLIITRRSLFVLRPPRTSVN